MAKLPRAKTLVSLLHLSLVAASSSTQLPDPHLPIIINTWSGPFTTATDAGHAALLDPNLTVLDAIQAAGSACESSQCDGTVGYGGSPDEHCETTLDAMMMDGNTLNVGAVGALRRVKEAVAVARHVLEYTEHTMLVGELATEFALEMGFKEQDLSTDKSRAACEAWRQAKCQPNSRVNVKPDPKNSCGPYEPRAEQRKRDSQQHLSRESSRGHDTISIVALDASGSMAAGTSTNGKAHKIPGRVGDGPIAGSGSYVDSDVGGCGATGDGDLMMRFLPCYQAVESMRRGLSPAEAAEDAVRRMVRKYPRIQAGLVVLNNKGEHAAAASNWQFSYSFRAGGMDKTKVITVNPLDAVELESAWSEL